MEDQTLLDNIKARMPELEKLLLDMNDHWTYEDYIYRFYHHSLKVYWAQDKTVQMVEIFKSLLPGNALNTDFLQIVKEGTDKTFSYSHNKEWLKHTRPMVEAFLHCKYFLEMIVKYGKELDKATDLLPSGWATVLYLYDLR